MKIEVLMIRTYETRLVYEANSFEEAVEMAKQDEDRFVEEMEQCYVIDEDYEEF